MWLTSLLEQHVVHDGPLSDTIFDLSSICQAQSRPQCKLHKFSPTHIVCIRNFLFGFIFLQIYAEQVNQYANANSFSMVFIFYASFYVHNTPAYPHSIVLRSCLFSQMLLSVTERRFVATLTFIKLPFDIGLVAFRLRQFVLHVIVDGLYFCSESAAIRYVAAIDHRGLNDKFVCDSKIKTYTFPIKFAIIIIFYFTKKWKTLSNANAFIEWSSEETPNE